MVESFDLDKVVLQTLPAEFLHEAAVLAAKSFRNTACYEYIYPGDADFRQQELEFLFERNIGLIYNRNPGTCYCGMDNSVNPPRLCCFFMLYNHETSMITFWEKITAGLLWLPFRSGFGSFLRLLKVSSFADSKELGMAAVGESYLRLGRMVVHPDYQGKGFAHSINS